MATIRKKRGKYQCLVRRSGYPVQSRTFTTKKLAEQWGRSVEAEMDQGSFLDLTLARRTTLGDVLRHYQKP